MKSTICNRLVRCLPIGVSLTFLLGLTWAPNVHAQGGCQASMALSMFPNTATTCATGLTPGNSKDVLITATNTCSTVPFPGTAVQCTLGQSGAVITYILACTNTFCTTELPGTIVFVPVGGSGCVSAATAGTTCAVDPGNANHVLITIPAPGLNLAAGAQFASVATVRVQAVSPVTTAACGEYGERNDTGPDDISTNDALCGVPATGGGAGSVNEFAPACVPGAVCQPGRMTGGGSIFNSPKDKKDRVTHGFELHCDVNDGPNRLEINWDGGNNFHLEQLTSAACFDDPTISPNPPDAGFDTYVGSGTGRCNNLPATATWTFTDAGEPGTNDTATVTITGGCSLSVSGNLDKGNQQAHK